KILADKNALNNDIRESPVAQRIREKAAANAQNTAAERRDDLDGNQRRGEQELERLTEELDAKLRLQEPKYDTPRQAQLPKALEARGAPPPTEEDLEAMRQELDHPSNPQPPSVIRPAPSVIRPAISPEEELLLQSNLLTPEHAAEILERTGELSADVEIKLELIAKGG